jgi:hypothetical protein
MCPVAQGTRIEFLLPRSTWLHGAVKRYINLTDCHVDLWENAVLELFKIVAVFHDPWYEAGPFVSINFFSTSYGMGYSYDRRTAGDFVLPRPSYLPPEVRGKKPYVPDGTDLAIWTWEEEPIPGRKRSYYGIVFAGKANKPLWYNVFGEESSRQRKIDQTIETRRSYLKNKQKEMQERLEFRHGLKEGDILAGSWGYDQTNVNFYQVTEVLGKDVILREIGYKPVRSERGMEYVVPTPDKFVGPPIRRRPTGAAGRASVKINNSIRAFLWDGKPMYQTAPGFEH